MSPEQLQRNRDKVRAWRSANPDKAKAVRQNWLDKLRQCILAAKAQGCSVCGESDPVCLDFHHLDPKTKSFNIGVQLGSYSLKRVKLEILKCEVLCANCHRKLHAAERLERAS